MQITSKAYKNEQAQYLRNEQYVYVYLGVVSREAQANAVCEGTFTSFSKEDDIFDNVAFEAYYATAEENFSRVNGDMFFMPRSDSYALYQGLVTESPVGSVRFTFSPYTHINIKGLTIDFGDYYPTEFTVTNGDPNYTYTYTNEKPGQWITEDEFLDSPYIEITAVSMVGGNQRFRIFSMLFGIGFQFDNYNLISTSWSSSVAHLSDLLPAKSFSFAIDNLDRNFSADNPHSFVAFLQEQQEVTVEYGRKLNDGTIYRMPGGKLNLTAWSSDDQQATFSAVGFLDYSNEVYKKGQFYPDGISLYDLAVLVCEDGGFEDYIIDSYLKTIKTHNPLPIETHKNCLQLIANAGMSILRENRNGVIEVKTSFIPAAVEITANGEVVYSEKENVVDTELFWDEYATAEQDFTYADGHQYFLPRDSASYVDTGYISSNLSGDDGTFLVNPYIDIRWETAWTFFNLLLEFSDVYPVSMMVHCYKEGTLIESFEQPECDILTNVIHDFYDIDEVRFEFTQTNPRQRIHLGKIYFGNVTDYNLDYRDMSYSPTVERTSFVKNVNVIYSEFSYGSEEKAISTITPLEGSNTVEFQNAYHGYAVGYAEIADDSTQYTKVAKKFVDVLPTTDKADTNTRYFRRKSGGYDMFVIEVTDGVKSWDSMGSVTESIVNSLPTTLSNNVLYCVRTDKEYIYHLYMKYVNEGVTSTISLGYDVRGTLNITESYAYNLTFTTNVESPVTIYGKEFVITQRTYSENLNDVGEDRTAGNVLIDNAAHATRECDWLLDYYANDVAYTINYRGEPALDPDDLIYIENRFVEKNLVRITETNIDTGTGMSQNCVIKARRIGYTEPAQVDYGIVDVSEVQE